MKLDVERLKKDLENQYGTAMYGGFPMAVMDVKTVENASEEELMEIARQQGICVEKYKK